MGEGRPAAVRRDRSGGHRLEDMGAISEWPAALIATAGTFAPAADNSDFIPAPEAVADWSRRTVRDNSIEYLCQWLEPVLKPVIFKADDSMH